MKPPPFRYHLPKTQEEVLQLLQSHENARVIAGGQSLMPMLNLRLLYLDHLIDLNGVEGLAYIREENDEVHIGAMTAQRTIEFSELVRLRLPLLSDAILNVGHRQTRNRGTIGGSLCHLDPAAELPLAAMVLDATIVVAGPGHQRIIKMADFAAGLMTPAIDFDEIITEIRIKPWPQSHGSAFIEYSRRKGDFAIVAVAALISIAADGRIDRASLAFGGFAPVPFRLHRAEAALVGNPPGRDLFARAVVHCAAIEPLDDPFAPGWYRRVLAAKLAQRALATACSRAERQGRD